MKNGRSIIIDKVRSVAKTRSGEDDETRNQQHDDEFRCLGTKVLWGGDQARTEPRWKNNNNNNKFTIDWSLG